MNHHGKDTSNGKDFVQAMSPKIAVGMFDSVASRTVAMRYIAGGAEVFYNSTDGAIRYPLPATACMMSRSRK